MKQHIWLNGQILPIEDAKVCVLSPTAQFGANVFEGIRCYWSDARGQLLGFRVEDHLRRLQQSARLFGLEKEFSYRDLLDPIIKVVGFHGFKTDIAIRQSLFVDGFGNWASGADVGMFVAPIAKGRELAPGVEGLNCCVSSWERISDNSLSPRVKVGANYINSRSAMREARRNNYDSAIFLNCFGQVSEGPGACVIMVRNGELITPPCTASILESITRETIIEIAKRSLGVNVVERPIDRTELYIADEVFFCGTAAEVTPIVSVDRFRISGGTVGPMTKCLMDVYFRAARGGIDMYRKWNLEIG